jgi:small subunit ribosomal protein S18
VGRPSYAGGGGSSGGDRRPRREYRQSYNRRKPCQFCVDKISYIDYKDIIRLRRYLSDRARIEPRRMTGTCAKHQRRLSTAIKRARILALLPFTPDQLKTLGFPRSEGFRGGREGGYNRGGSSGGRYQRPEGGGGGYRSGGYTPRTATSGPAPAAPTRDAEPSSAPTAEPAAESNVPEAES